VGVIIPGCTYYSKDDKCMTALIQLLSPLLCSRSTLDTGAIG